MVANRKKAWGFPRWGSYEQSRDTVFKRMCDWHGCNEIGEHPAPKTRYSKDREKDHFWFCQLHAGIYNRNWNFFRGLSDQEARAAEEAERRRAESYADAGPWDYTDAGLTKEERERRDALHMLGLQEHATADEIKASFRTLAMRYHPDRNRDDDLAADKFRQVCEAYELLR